MFTDGKITNLYNSSSSISKSIDEGGKQLIYIPIKVSGVIDIALRSQSQDMKKMKVGSSSSFSSCHTYGQEHENMVCALLSLQFIIRAESVQFSTFLLVSKLALVNEHQRKRHIACCLNLIKRLRGIYIIPVYLHPLQWKIWTGKPCVPFVHIRRGYKNLLFNKDIVVWTLQPHHIASS